MPAIDVTIPDHFLSLRQDAVLWKAAQIWTAAGQDPDDQATAMEQLVSMVACIDNETKRTSYIETIQKQNKIKGGLLKKGVRDLLQRREAEKQRKIAQKKLEAQFQNAEEAGLAQGFNGNMHDALKYGIYEHEGVYYTRGIRGADFPVSNFTMRILYHVNTGEERAFRLLAVKNVYGFEAFINMNTDDFVSLGSFRKVLARRGDYIFKGTDADLIRLSEYLQKDEVSTEYIKSLGWHKRGRFYAFANGIVTVSKEPGAGVEFVPIDEYGIIHQEKRNYFIPACSKMYVDKDEEFVNEKKFKYREPVAGFGFQEWADLFYQTYGEKSSAALLWYIGSLFRDVIMKQIQRYPIMNLFGPPGAGKGQLAESLMCMFGERQDQIMLGGASTVVGFMRKFAQFVNAIVWLDEYKNNLPPKFIESFKNLYDGKGYERGKMTNDFSTESTPIHSSCILAGQDMPTVEPALFMRVILLSFEEGKFSNEQRQCFQKLKDIEATGLSYISAQLLQYRHLVETNFKEQFQIILKRTIVDVANVEIDDRMIVNISILLTFFDLLKDHVRFPFTYSDAKAFLIKNMERQHAILAGNNDVAKFWSVVENLFYQKLIQDDIDFMLEDGYIYLRLMQVHPLYLKEMKTRGDVGALAKPTLEHYLQLDKTVFSGYVRKRFPDGSNNWTYKMRYNKLGIDLLRIKNPGNMNMDTLREEYRKRHVEMGIEIVDDTPFGHLTEAAEAFPVNQS